MILTKLLFSSLLIILIASCVNEGDKQLSHPSVHILEELQTILMESDFEDKLLHRGILSPDFQDYYFTTSDKEFTQFNVWVTSRKDGNWVKPKQAFFNSEYSDHGMSFSSDGKSLFFSSTRPTYRKGVADTWHIWRSEWIDQEWSDASYVDIPNLRDKLISHPSITDSGSLYFHSSNLDYSEMQIYRAEYSGNGFGTAEKVEIPSELHENRCTPYISKEEDFLIYARIGKQLDLMITYLDSLGKWTAPSALNEKINHQGQGNPYVVGSNEYLFYTTGDRGNQSWQVNWIDFKEIF